MNRHKKAPGELMGVRGFARVQLVNSETGRITADTGYTPNTVTAGGFQFFIVGCTGGVGASTQLSHLALSTKTTAIASGDNTIAGETGGRKSANKTFVANGTLRMTASWAGSDLGAGSPATLGSIAMFGTSSSGTLAAAALFSTQQWTSDQNVNATYDLRFS